MKKRLYILLFYLVVFHVVGRSQDCDTLGLLLERQATTKIQGILYGTGFCLDTLEIGSGLSLTGGLLEATATSGTRSLIPVREFGAAMDGTTNDYTAIRESLDSLGYAFLLYDEQIGETQTRINQTLYLRNGEVIFSNNRKMMLKSYVSADSFAVRFLNVPFEGYAGLIGFSIDCVNANSHGIQIYQCRQAHIEGVYLKGNTTAKRAIHIDGDDETGNAWNHIRDFNIVEFEKGIELKTTDTLNYCNRNFIAFGTIQSCDTALIIWRASTNMIQDVGCQNSTIHIYCKSAQNNYIRAFNETASSFSLVTDNDSYNNIFAGNIGETQMSLGTGRNIFLDGNYLDLNKVSNDFWFANLPLTGTDTEYTHVIRTATGSNDNLSIGVASHQVITIFEDGANDYTQIDGDLKMTSGSEIQYLTDNAYLTTEKTVDLQNVLFNEAGTLPGTTGIFWNVPTAFNGYTILAARYSVASNSCASNITGRLQLNGGADFASRNITAGNTSSELTSVSQAIATADRLTATLTGCTAGGDVYGLVVTLTIKKL
jgi:hypothetical protein